MPRDPIIGSGRKGFGFEQKGFQERNLGLLLETLSKKETQKSIEALSKIDRDEWTAMATTATMLNSFVSLGGASTLISSVKETIKLQIDSILSPLTNEINQHITDILTPFISDILTPMINDLNAFLSENNVGAGIGGIAGSILGYFLPGGILWIAIGSIMGAKIEEDLTGERGPLLSQEEFEQFRIDMGWADPPTTPILPGEFVRRGRRIGGPQEDF